MLDLPYQREGAAFLAARKTALLADDPGLGKTVQAIRACDLARVLRVLVICPAAVVENWRREIMAHREGDWQAAVFSYDAAVEKYRPAIMRDWFDRIIIDEAHFLKEITAKRTRAIYGFNSGFEISAAHSIVQRGGAVSLLSGTPMPNYPNEIYTHLRALHQDAIVSSVTGKPYTYVEFEERYCRKKFNGTGWAVAGSRNEEELHRKLSSFMLRRRKADVLKQLPPLRFSEVWLEGRVEGHDEEAQSIRDALEKDGVDGLRRLTVNGSISTLRRLTGIAKAEPAAAWVKNWLDSTPADRKIVVFAHHKQVIDVLWDRLHPWSVRFDGSMKQHERQRAVDRLQRDENVRCFIGQITAAGVGLTLTKADTLLFVEQSWTPADNAQAWQRIHRISQENPCEVLFGTLAGSVDEDIQRACMRKMRSIGMVVDGEFE